MLNPDIPQTLLSRLAFHRQMLLQAAARRDHLVAEIKVTLPKTTTMSPSEYFTESQRTLCYETQEPPYRAAGRRLSSIPLFSPFSTRLHVLYPRLHVL